MARGFESKAVESQQADSQASQQLKRTLSDEERVRSNRRITLSLALTQAQAELQAACRPGHRDMLNLKLQALKAELGTLERF